MLSLVGHSLGHALNRVGHSLGHAHVRIHSDNVPVLTDQVAFAVVLILVQRTLVSIAPPNPAQEQRTVIPPN